MYLNFSVFIPFCKVPDLETHRFRSWCILVYLNFPAFVPESKHRTANRERMDSGTKVDRMHYLLLEFTTVHLDRKGKSLDSHLAHLDVVRIRGGGVHGA